MYTKPVSAPVSTPMTALQDKVIRDTGKLHDDNTEILHTLRDLCSQKFLHGHVPPNVVYWSRTVIESVGDGRDLRIGSSFGKFFERTMDISYRGLCLDDDLTIHLQNVLKNSVRSRMGRTEIQIGVLFLFRRNLADQ
jgi:hypothetical protein